MKSFLLEINERVRAVPATNRKRPRLTRMYDELRAALHEFIECPSTKNMITLNGVWVRAVHAYLDCPAPKPPNGPKRKVA